MRGFRVSGFQESRVLLELQGFRMEGVGLRVQGAGLRV